MSGSSGRYAYRWRGAKGRPHEEPPVPNFWPWRLADAGVAAGLAKVRVEPPRHRPAVLQAEGGLTSGWHGPAAR